MKLNLLAVAIAAFSMPSSHAAPSQDLLQLKLSIDLSGPAAAPTTVLLVFVGNQPARLGNFYSVNTTVDGAKFSIENPIDVWLVEQYGSGNCTVNTKDGRSFTLVNYGLEKPVSKTVDPAGAFIGGSCGPPDTGDNDAKLGL
ncbi:hypothetical protein OEA41_002443 [Lepraria neglecta]|uniref:Uncharacterized protein n=1 Tax=Lepraria neglecta TaxID=209136 RepID=A0AAD9ZF30_9LECA|nr:hypothetical protein OEA41_002443 [Lepraria neglecta]